MWRASPFPPPCNGDLHSDFRIRVPFGRNWSDLLLVERLHPREKMTHRTCLVFFLWTFLKKGKQASQGSTITKYLHANPSTTAFRAPSMPLTNLSSEMFLSENWSLRSECIRLFTKVDRITESSK